MQTDFRMKKAYVVLSCMLMITCGAMCRKADPSALNNDNNFDPRLSGGAATFFDLSSSSFGTPIPGLSAHDEFVHELGDKLFEQPFLAAPAPKFGGLGPVFNNISCVNCHHNDGFGQPTFGQLGSSLLMRISIPGDDGHGGPNPAPGFGGQLQNRSLLGVKPEVQVNLSYGELAFTFADGENVSLRVPAYALYDSYIPLPAGYMTSPRLGPPVFGLGLLENIPEATIISFSDPGDANNDGIKGHPNYVYNSYSGKRELGRFGMKANTSTLQVQVATAFQQDMGLTSYVQPVKSVHGQEQMNYVPAGTATNLADTALNAVVFYIRTLAVPARRNVTDPRVKRGELLFKKLNCAGCHIPTMYTGIYPALPTLSNQRIHPYTDMLVHDLGEGLSDNRPDYQATGREWRTAPLWGIGMFEKTNGVPYYLHDGRARTLTEAIIWHGGEAQNSRDQFAALPKKERMDMIAFLQSL
jgi:CxxC motif-containing protein (DUF1111 family)